MEVLISCDAPLLGAGSVLLAGVLVMAYGLGDYSSCRVGRVVADMAVDLRNVGCIWRMEHSRIGNFRVTVTSVLPTRGSGTG